MPTVFEGIAAQARGTFYDVFASQASYAQGNVVANFVAIKSNPGDRMKTEEEAAVWAEFSEFVLKTADLGGIAPKRGDTITAEGKTWRVLSPSEMMPVFEFVDSEEMEVRIFCKLTE